MALSSALSSRCHIHFLASATPRLFATAGHFVDRGPCAPFGFFAALALLLVSFFNVFGLAFLFVRVLLFRSSGHRCFLYEMDASGKPPNAGEQCKYWAAARLLPAFSRRMVLRSRVDTQTVLARAWKTASVFCGGMTLRITNKQRGEMISGGGRKMTSLDASHPVPIPSAAAA
jgi:hypothetical protein